MLPTISISGGSVAEGNNSFPFVQFTVTLSQTSANPVTVRYFAGNGTAIGDGDDFFDEFGTLTFNPGETSKVINVQIDGQDLIDEADESIVMHLYNPTQADFAGGLTTISALGFILDDDGAGNNLGVFVNSAEIIEGDAGTKQAVFEVWLSRPATGQTIFNYATVNGSAVAGEDFVAKSGSVTFESGQQVRTVTVDLIGDTIPELAEIFSLAVTPTGAVANGAQGAVGEVVIKDDDAFGGNLPTISVSRGEMVENASGFPFVWFKVSLSEPSPNPVTVRYITSGDTAGPEGDDFFDDFGTITFQPGQTTEFVAVQIDSNDTIDEADERLFLRLYNPTQAVLAGDQISATASGFILDDDGFGNNLGLFVSDPTIVETDSGKRQAVFEIELSRPSDVQQTFDFTTVNGSAVAGEDYLAKSGTVVFAPGQTFAAVIVDILGDTKAEISENFSLALTPTGAIGNGAQGAAGTATILDDDTAGGNFPTLSVSGAAVVENASGFPVIQYIVTLSAPSANPVSFSYRSIGGTAGADGDDFFDQFGTTTLQPGQTTAIINVQVDSNDTIDETDESVILELSSPFGAVLAGGQPVLRTSGFILDDDGFGANLGLFVSDPVITEGTGGQSFAVFEITLSRPSDSDLTFNYQTQDGTAVAGVDYTARSGSVTFLAGQQTASVIVPVAADILTERTEIFSLAVTPTGAIANGAQGAVGEATILDDDAGAGLLPVISVSRGEIVESASGFPAVWMLVSLSQPSANVVRVNYATSSGSAIEGTDFFDSTGQLTFQPGQTALSILVQADSNDNVGLESDEFFFFDLTNPQGAVLEGGLLSLREVGIILDDDGFDDNTTLIVTDVVEAENQASDGGFVEVHLSRPSNSAITFNYTTQNASAVSGSDFVGGAGSFTFQPGQTTARIPIVVIDDGLVEQTERFIINIAANGAVENGASGFSINVDLTDGDDTGSALDDDIILGGSTITERVGNNGLNKIVLAAPAANDFVLGEGGADLIAGGLGSDFLNGGVGNDTLHGEAGHDSLLGGDGGDRLFGGAGDDTLDGGGGSDFMDGGDGNDLMTGQSGRDTVLGGVGDDSVDAAAGDDSVDGGANNDRIFGGTGFDLLLGGNGNDTLAGGDDNDTLTGGKGFDFLLGQIGNDSLIGEDLSDTLVGGDGNDTLNGGIDNDRLIGEAQRDLIFGDAGDDIVDAGTGNDTVDGGGQRDSVFGGSGFDLIDGGSGNDTLTGGTDGDTLLGGAGFDILQGDAGDDVLNGGLSNDVIFGNAGNDTIIFDLGGGVDTVRDFTAGAASEDVIRLVGFGAAFNTFAEVIGAATQTGNHVTIDFGNGDALIIRNTLVASLHADDFTFG